MAESTRAAAAVDRGAPQLLLLHPHRACTYHARGPPLVLHPLARPHDGARFKSSCLAAASQLPPAK